MVRALLTCALLGAAGRGAAAAAEELAAGARERGERRADAPGHGEDDERRGGEGGRPGDLRRASY